MKKMYLTSAVLAAILAVSMTGCGTKSNTGSTASNTQSVITAQEDSADTADAAVNADASGSYEVVAMAQTAAADDAANSELFTSRDLAQTADNS